MVDRGDMREGLGVTPDRVLAIGFATGALTLAGEACVEASPFPLSLEGGHER